MAQQQPDHASVAIESCHVHWGTSNLQMKRSQSLPSGDARAVAEVFRCSRNGKKRERERERDRETETERQRDRDRDRERQRETERDRQIDRQKDRDRLRV